MSYEAWGEPDDSPYDRAIEDGWLNPEDLSKAMLDVISERERQEVKEGFSPVDDDRYVRGELILAAITFGVNAQIRTKLAADGWSSADIERASSTAALPKTWPKDWGPEFWKPRDARSNLVRAAALLVAEIERLDRAAKVEEA